MLVGDNSNLLVLFFCAVLMVTMIDRRNTADWSAPTGDFIVQRLAVCLTVALSGILIIFV